MRVDEICIFGKIRAPCAAFARGRPTANLRVMKKASVLEFSCVREVGLVRRAHESRLLERDIQLIS